jgi:hypothetical protein
MPDCANRERMQQRLLAILQETPTALDEPPPSWHDKLATDRPRRAPWGQEHVPTDRCPILW